MDERLSDLLKLCHDIGVKTPHRILFDYFAHLKRLSIFVSNNGGMDYICDINLGDEPSYVAEAFDEAEAELKSLLPENIRLSDLARQRFNRPKITKMCLATVRK